MNFLKRLACDFWGLTDTSYILYDENGKAVQTEEGNQILTADKYFETSGAKSSGTSSKMALLYIGRREEHNNSDLLEAFKSQKEKRQVKNANQ